MPNWKFEKYLYKLLININLYFELIINMNIMRQNFHR